MRLNEAKRVTKETDVFVSLCLEGTGKSEVSTGIGFFDHMLTAFAMHGGFDLTVKTTGDLEVDCHHTIEDTAIVLGDVFASCVGDKAGINRYGNAFVPMDEAMAHVSLDISGRPFLVFDASFSSDRMGEFDTQMVIEFFRAFAFHSGITLHAKVPYGANDHHKTEALFKALGQALKQAVSLNGAGLLSTKGVL